jgi:hypothetical protein
MPIIAAALVLVLRARLQSGAGFSPAAMALIAAVVALPYVMESQVAPFPLSAPCSACSSPSPSATPCGRPGRRSARLGSPSSTQPDC